MMAQSKDFSPMHAQRKARNYVVLIVLLALVFFSVMTVFVKLPGKITSTENQEYIGSSLQQNEAQP